LRLRTIRTRVAEIERKLGGIVDQKRTEFDRQVLLWLMGNPEYRSITQDLFERICESEAPMEGDYIWTFMTPFERDRIRSLTEEAERSVAMESAPESRRQVAQ